MKNVKQYVCVDSVSPEASNNAYTLSVTWPRVLEGVITPGPASLGPHRLPDWISP